MHANTFSHFLEMGGYAVYVWSAYGFAFLVMVFVMIISLVNHRKQLRKVLTYYEEEA